RPVGQCGSSAGDLASDSQCRVAIQDGCQAGFQLQLVDKQTVELGEWGAEGNSAQGAQLVFRLQPSGMASFYRDANFRLMIHVRLS
ncbi:MAG: hypothetical protein ACYCV7_03050, partial [Acidimicrobiales bacterium]